MSLTIALQSALSGLRANQAGIELVSRNVATSTTAGYTRKIVPQEALVIGGQGAGVKLGEVERQVNQYLQRQLRGGVSSSQSLAVIQSFLGRFELSLGKPGDNTSIGNIAGGLADAFRSLATTPESVTAQTAVVHQAQQLASTFNRLSDTVQGLRNEAERGIGESVDEINQVLKDIEDLNRQIVTAHSTGQGTADLEDQRDRKVDALSQQIGINYFKRDNGEISIMTASGRTLVDGAAHQLVFVPVSQVMPGSTYPATLGGVTLDGIDLFQSPPATPPATEVASGRLAGLADLRDRILPQAQLQLDELASVMTQQLSGLAPPLELFRDGAAAYLPANVTGYAQRIVVNPAVISQPWRLRDGTAAAGPNTTTPSDDTLPRAVIDAFEAVQTFSAATGLGTQFTFGQYGAALIGFQGAQALDFAEQAANQDAINAALGERFTGESGVNVDEEMALMVQLQNSYQANARVVTAIKEMLDALLAIG